MTLGESTKSRLVFSRQTVPLDMVGVAAAAILSGLVYYFVSASPLRLLVSVPLLLFFTGYVLVGILFPRHGDRPQSHSESIRGSLATARNLGRITGPERAALAFGLSVALVPFFGFGLELLPVEAFDGAILPTLVGFVLIGALIGSVRRLRVPADERFRIPLGRMRAAAMAPFGDSMPRAERFATLALAATVLLAVLSVGYVFAVPQQGEQFTDLRVMTESPDGELVLGNYPDEIPVDETAELFIGVDNYEGQQREYTVVATTQAISQTQDGGLEPGSTTELDRFETTLEDGERTVEAQTLTPESTGQYRVSYYLYMGDAPAEPTADSAYRNVHFTVTAVDPAATAVDGGPATNNSTDTNGSDPTPITGTDPDETTTANGTVDGETPTDDGSPTTIGGG